MTVHESRAAALLPALYAHERDHWWSVGMRAITHALLAGQPLPEGAILEIGCGGGAFLRELALSHPQRPMLGVDLNPLALAHARAGGVAQVARCDLHRLPLPAEQAALVVALDAFDQQGVDLLAALIESRRILRPGGLLLLRVSAYPWLQGPHDTAFGTGRRYSAEELCHTLAAANLSVERLTHANSLLLLPAIAVRLAQQGGHSAVDAQLAVHPLVNQLLKKILQVEAAWLNRMPLPAGLSLYALARK